MEKKEILSKINHILLDPAAGWKQVKEFCKTSLEQGCGAVTIHPCYVKQAKELFPELKICTVVDFPFGCQSERMRPAEAWEARVNGADEIDVMVNMSKLKAGEMGEIRGEIGGIRQLLPDRVLKVTVETCNLTYEEKIALCVCVAGGGADYIKTSTCFGREDAKIEDVKLFRELLGGRIKIEASGREFSREEMEELLAAGCDRIGCCKADILWR